MPRKRIHELAKEWGMDTRQAIAKLELVGIHGKKAQSTLTDSELTLVHKGEAPEAASPLVLGEDKVVAERVVTEVGHNEHLVAAREEIHENRIRQSPNNWLHLLSGR